MATIGLEQAKPSLRERMDDYSLQRVPEHAKRKTADSWLMLFGASTCMYPLLIGATVASSVTFTELIWIMLLGLVANFVVCFLVCAPAQQEGLTIDLISRNVLGSRGSVLTSGIYGFTDLLFFSFEAAFLATAVIMAFKLTGFAVMATNFVVCLMFIPLVIWGFGVMVWVARIGLPLYLLAQAWALFDLLGARHIDVFAHVPTVPVAVPILFGLNLWMSNIAINAVQGADYARFLTSRRAVLSISGGWGPLMFPMPALGYLFFVATGVVDPGTSFVILFGVLGAFLALVSQLKINTNNAYTASLALSNFFSQAFNVRPGRHWFAALATIIGFAALQIGVLDKVETLLTINAYLVMAWCAVIVADYWVVRGMLKLGSPRMGLKGLPAVNPVGVVSLVVAIIAAQFFPAILGMPWVNSVLVAFVLQVVGSMITKGVYARNTDEVNLQSSAI